MSDREYYGAMPLEVLGKEGCCKVFCQEYRRLAPSAQLWGVKRADGSLAHVFVVHHGTAYDVRGPRGKEDMPEESSEAVSEISQGEFDEMSTFADAEKPLREVAAQRFAQALKADPKQYGLDH